MSRMTEQEHIETLEQIEAVIDRAKKVQERLDVPADVRAMAGTCFLTYALELVSEVLADLPQERWAQPELVEQHRRPQPAEQPVVWVGKVIKS